MARYIIKDGKKYAPSMSLHKKAPSRAPKFDKNNPDDWNDDFVKRYVEKKGVDRGYRGINRWKNVTADEAKSIHARYAFLQGDKKKPTGGNGQVKSYTRRTKSGKTVTVKAHTRKKRTTRPIGSGTNGPVRKK